MAEDRCTLILNKASLSELPERLKFVFGPDVFEMEGSAENWSLLSVKRRRLIRMVSVMIEPIAAAQLPHVLQHLQHIFRVVETENGDIKEKLLLRIATGQAALEIHAKGGFRGLEKVIFETAKFLDAIIFWENDKMLNADGKLILDFNGNTVLQDLPVEVDAEFLDRLTPKSPEGEARKEKTNAFLKERNVPFSEKLPVIEGESTAKFRPKEAVVERALALLLVALKGEGLEDAIVAQVSETFGIGAFLSPQERNFIQDSEPLQQTRVNFAWRYEGLSVMLWALGLQAELPFPNKICDVAKLVETVRELGSKAAILNAANMRSASTLLDEMDLIYRLNWACVNARLKGAPAPAGLESGVVFERHYALNWLRIYLDQDWDDVRTDT